MNYGNSSFIGQETPIDLSDTRLSLVSYSISFSFKAIFLTYQQCAVFKITDKKVIYSW